MLRGDCSLKNTLETGRDWAYPELRRVDAFVDREEAVVESGPP